MRPLRLRWYLALATALAAGFLARAHSVAGRTAPPLDDAFIHFQYATQLAAGEPFRFAPGEACTSGATSFLWPVLLAPAAALGAHGVTLYAWSVVLGVVSLAGAAWLVARWATALSDEATGGLAGLLVVASGPLLWGAASGMEIAVAAVATAGLLDGLERGRRPVGWALVLALARPEGALVAGAVLLPDALAAARSGARARAVAAVVPGLAGVAAPTVVALTCSDSLVPTSVLAKRNPRFPSLEEVSRLGYAVDDLVLGGLGEHWYGRAGLLVVVLAGVGLAALVTRDLRAARPGAGFRAIAALALPTAVVAVTVPFGTHYRYLMPFAPVFLVAALLGARAIDGAVARAGAAPLPWARGALAAVALAGVPGWAVAFGDNTRDIAQQQVAVAEWIAAHTDAGARVAINDAGAMGHLAGRRVLDLEGIVSDGAVRHALAGEGATLALLRRERPDYVAVYPTWFDGLFEAGLVREVLRVDLVQRTVSGAEVMVVGTLDAARLDSARLPPALDPGERVVDALDVSDVDDEAAHAWSAAGDPLRLARDNDVHAGAVADGSERVDGARRLFGDEAFTMRAAGGPAQLVARLGPATAATLELWLDGRRLGPVTLPAVEEGRWVEVGWPMPPLPAGDVRIELRALELLPGDAGGRVIAGWWWVERG